MGPRFQGDWLRGNNLKKERKQSCMYHAPQFQTLYLKATVIKQYSTSITDTQINGTEEVSQKRTHTYRNNQSTN